MQLVAFAIMIGVLSSAIELVNADSTTKHYVVYMGEHLHPNSEAVINANHDILASIIGSMDEAQKSAVHHYSKTFRGFSAMLTPEQARRLAGDREVISVFESRTHVLHTTRSWEFLGVDAATNIYPTATMYPKSDVIIGVIDTGVWPESKSFNDQGLGPAPRRFKGECITGENFTLANCNRKIIGARFYSKGYEAEHGRLESLGGIFFRSARDSEGHGSHIASTSAGSAVANASLFGLAAGTARGGAPAARLAIYKACWFRFCNDADVLSAFDDAIHDGVDLISISAGPLPPQPSFFSDSFSIGSFHAFRNGILTSASTGNAGLPATATNVAPWMLTVAASSLDRRFDSSVTLGNSKVLKGQSINPLKMDSFNSFPASIAAAPGIPSKNASFCANGTLVPALIEGKIVVCTIETVLDNRTDKSVVVKEAGGVGMILIDPVASDVGFEFVIPATLVGAEDAGELQAYLATEKNPTAIISSSQTVFHTRPAPEMAVFSSQGPNLETPDIIKPDITAPGLNILAAWSPLGIDRSGGRSVDYNIASGTSQASPHVTGMAAIIKSCNMLWSPAAIKSALMTTATVMDNTGNTIARQPNASPTTPFDYGSGHINSLAALDPGLVYDHNADDIINFLCSNGASIPQLLNLTGERIVCNNVTVPPYNLNYPSIGISSMNGSLSVYRTVTNYGSGHSTYLPKIENPVGMKLGVSPRKLEFNKRGQKLTYRLDFVPYKHSNGSFVFGSIAWTDGRHVVRSPIAVNVVSV